MNRSMKRTGLLALAAGVVLLGAIAAHAQVPQLMNYQGVLKDGTGTPIDGTVSILFSIYDVPTGGTALWSETQGSVTVTNGLFNVLLGSSTTLPPGLFFDPPASNNERYLGVKVGSDPEMTPRQRLVSVSDALKAEDADSLGDRLAVVDKPAQTLVVGPVGPGAQVVVQKEFATHASDNLIAAHTAFGDPSRVTVLRAGGTIAAPTAVLNHQTIGTFLFKGYMGTGFQVRGNASVTARASENFTPTAQGTEMWLATTPIGTTIPKIRLFVANDGNVGIGTDVPSQPLTVNGNVLATAYLTSSSRELKKDITPLAQQDYQEIMHQINGIQMVRYLYKTESDRQPHLGVIAEESPQEILDPGGKAVSLSDYAGFILAGLKAQAEQMKTQSALIKAQAEQIKALTEKIRDLEAKQ